MTVSKCSWRLTPSDRQSVATRTRRSCPPSSSTRCARSSGGSLPVTATTSTPRFSGRAPPAPRTFPTRPRGGGGVGPKGGERAQRAPPATPPAMLAPRRVADDLAGVVEDAVEQPPVVVGERVGLFGV